MATIIALTNQKGGVGKTTTSSSLAAGLSTFYHKKVLAIDLDPQGSLGFSLGLDIENSHTIYDVLKGSIPIQDAIQSTDYCDVVTSNILLSSAELEFTSSDRELCLKKALAPVLGHYDFVIIDTPPADHLIIPMAPEILSLLGLTQLKETIDSVREKLNPSLNVLGLILTKYNKRTLLAREVKEMAENIAEQIGSCVFDTQIRASVSVAESPAHGLSIYDHSPRSNPSLDYKNFVKEVMVKTGHSISKEAQ